MILIEIDVNSLLTMLVPIRLSPLASDEAAKPPIDGQLFEKTAQTSLRVPEIPLLSLSLSFLFAL